MSEAARRDWTTRIGRRSDPAAIATDGVLAAPTSLTATTGHGHVTLRWAAVPGAIGYVVHRAEGDGPLVAIDHGGGDSVMAVPGPFADTGGSPGVACRYGVAAISSPDHPPGPLSDVVEAKAASGAGAGAAAEVMVSVDAGRPLGELRRPWWMVGSERLSQLDEEGATGGVPIGTDFAAALRRAADELGVEAVRAHAILHDDLGVYREIEGRPQIDFGTVDRVYDRVLDAGCRPIVEVSFMPRDLARDPSATVFAYRAVVSPPRDWDRWTDLVQRLAAHLVDRYGVDEVATWGFEIWNEPNLEVFWAGTQAEYFRLYELSARAIKSVDAHLRVGGPATAAGGWIPEFADFVQQNDVPLDFVTTHAYGIPPLDFREALGDRGLGDIPIWWTEWGVAAIHNAFVNDLAYGAPFVLRGMRAGGRVADAIAYWVVSDHFEEMGRGPSLLHGGFGLLTVGNLRKPRYWALALAADLGREELDVSVAGDGADSLVEAMAARHPDGTVHVLMWNVTLNQSQAKGAAVLGRSVRVRVAGLPAPAYEFSLARIDHDHSNIGSQWRPDDGAAWPDADGWERLQAADRLWERSLGAVTLRGPPGGGADAATVELTVDLPMPGVARLRLRPHAG
jgi:xylan 1,4-beta-xylosidase